MGKIERTYTDLTFVGTSGLDGEIVTFGAPSRHDATRTNLVSLDQQTGAIHCTCKHCETHPGEEPRCWLAREVRKADFARRMGERVVMWTLAGCQSRDAGLRRKVADGTATEADRVMLDMLGDRIAELTAPSTVAA